MINAAHRRAALAGALALILFGACSTSPTVVDAGDVPGALPPALATFAEQGDRGVVSGVGTMESEWGCLVRYEVYEPAPSGADAGDRGVTVVLGHGFMRSGSNMRAWAEHWASHGVRSVAVSFCNSTWLNGRHDRNAADLVHVAALSTEPGSPVIYAGFSAGGLSALLATAADDRAVAYLGLDSVDSSGLAEAAAGTVAGAGTPALFLFGEPSPCNADGNMTPLVPEAERTSAWVVPFATHCDFEYPTDPACGRFCGRVEPVEAQEAVLTTIRAVATAWVIEAARGATELDPGLIASLQQEGRIRPVARPGTAR